MTEYELSKSLLEKKDTGVPMLNYLRIGIGLLIYRLVMIAVCVYLYDNLGGAWQIALILAIGGLLGATSQELYLHIKGQKNWPLLKKLYDWNRIEEIVNKKTKEDSTK